MESKQNFIFQVKRAAWPGLIQMQNNWLEMQSVYSNLADLDQELPEIIEEVKPSVVCIIGDESAGSGIIVSEDGNIITNAHVVENNKHLQVELWNNEVFQAYVQSIDPFSDLALLKIEKTGLKPVTFADNEEIKKGKVVLAVGSPEFFRESVTMGIISGLNRGLDGEYPYRLIQTDAVINHGNSGGPLFNLKGEVVGINTFGLDSQESSKKIEVMNFAIPADTVQYVLSNFYKYGFVKRPYLGIMMLGYDLRSPGIENGAVVLGVVKGSSADKAGIKEGDIIRKAGDTPVTGNPIDFYELMKHYLPGEQLTLSVERNKRQMEIPVVLESYDMDSVMTKTICITKQIV